MSKLGYRRVIKIRPSLPGQRLVSWYSLQGIPLNLRESTIITNSKTKLKDNLPLNLLEYRKI